ncbi:MAG: hypothetical protein AAGA25_05080 [Planctomycetota bacterium]
MITTPSPTAAGPTTGLRQNLLFLYLANSSLSSAVVAWSNYDGTTTDPPEMDDPEPPYTSALAAMRDGWRVLQVSPLTAPPTGREFDLDYLKFEVILEKLEEVSV